MSSKAVLIFEYQDYPSDPTIINVGLSLRQVNLLLAVLPLLLDRQAWGAITPAEFDDIDAEVSDIIEELS